MIAATLPFRFFPIVSFYPFAKSSKCRHPERSEGPLYFAFPSTSNLALRSSFWIAPFAIQNPCICLSCPWSLFVRSYRRNRLLHKLQFHVIRLHLQHQRVILQA